MKKITFTRISTFILLLLVNLTLLIGCGTNNQNPAVAGYIIEFEDATPSVQPDEKSEFKNFYGIGWPNYGLPADNMRFAKNMSYKYIMASDKFGKSEDLLKFKYYFDTPQDFYFVELTSNKTWGVSRSRNYTPEEKYWINERVVWKSTKADDFPENLAMTNIWSKDSFMPGFDFQQNIVIDEVINGIFERINKDYSNFPFAGFCFDSPGLHLNFQDYANGRVVEADLPNDTCQCPKTHDSKTYTEGYAKFLCQLITRARQLNPDAQIFVEPPLIYDYWVKPMSETAYSEILKGFFVSQEGGLAKPGQQIWEFYEDERIFKLINRDNIGCSAPTVHDEPGNRLLAAQAAINGSWFNWFGRLGGTDGDGIIYSSITEVPAFLKLIRVVANWDNLAKADNRKWDGQVYSSTNSLMDGRVIATRNPYNGKLFVVFLDKQGTVDLSVIGLNNKKVKAIKRIDAWFGEAEDGTGDLAIVDGKLRKL